jgi:tetratricopeptide (TPR) repeat protein
MRRLLADVLRALGRDEEAYDQWAESHAVLGREYQAAGFLDRALEEYRLAADLTEHNADFLAAQGMVYARLADWRAADSLFALALKRDPQNHKALYGAGILKGDQKNYGDAVGFLLRALAVRPDDGATHYALAVNYYFLNDLDKAKKHVEKAIKLGAVIRENFIQALSHPAGQP